MCSSDLVAGKLTVEYLESAREKIQDVSCIGGLVGLFGRNIDNSLGNDNDDLIIKASKMSGDINVSNNNNVGKTYVGGIVGAYHTLNRYETYITAEITSKVIAAYSRATTTTTGDEDIYDARTFADYSGYYTANSIEHYSNYKIKKLPIPLVVGGAIGYFKSGNLNGISVTINNGSIRALLVVNDVSDIDTSVNLDKTVVFESGNVTTTVSATSSTYMGSYWDSDWNSSGDWTAYLRTSQIKNGESAQARCGGIVGLINGNGSDRMLQSLISGTEIKSSHRFNTNGTSLGRVLRLFISSNLISDNNRKGWAMIPKMKNQVIGYYSLGKNLDKDNIYYSVGSSNISGMVTERDSLNIKVGASYTAFNYPLVSGSNVSSSLARSSIWNGSIFSQSITDYIYKYNGTYEIWIDDDQSYNGDLNVYSVSSYSSANDLREDSANNVTVFAGFCKENYYAYNRSFWLVPNDGNSGQVLFYPTQHWAGPNIGGVLADA